MKLSKFNNYLESSGEYILHNTLYDSAIRLYNKEYFNNMQIFKNSTFNYEDLEKYFDDFFIKALIENKFIVIDNNIDEISFLNYRFYKTQQRFDEILSIMIIPTRECNFRCPYCYEEHTDSNMDSNTFENIIKFIEGIIATNNNITSLSIEWFGGEPTLKNKEIIHFMNKLKEYFKDIRVYGGMTTNGYLLNVEDFQKLVEAGIVFYQITVDGLSDTHNSTRILKNGAGTWQKIINNLLDIKKINLDYNILLRTNISEEVFVNMNSWTTFLQENFSDDSRFTYHMETVKDLGKKSEYQYSYSNKMYENVGSMMRSKGMRLNLERFLTPFGLICYAANPSHFTIDFDGAIKKCTVALDNDDNIIGNVNNIKDSNISYIDWPKMAKWTSYNLYNKCADCGILPICYGKKCPLSFNSPGGYNCEQLKQMYSDLVIAEYKKNDINQATVV